MLINSDDGFLLKLDFVGGADSLNGLVVKVINGVENDQNLSFFLNNVSSG
nr:hypothetical protein [Synechococcus sp. PCC 6312]